MSIDSDDVIGPRRVISSLNQIGTPGTLLFFDSLLVVFTAWIYWLIVVSKTTPFEVGQATAVFSLVALVSTLIQLGLEYPLLKRSLSDRSTILMTILTVELLITLATIPAIYFVINHVFQQSSIELSRFTWIAVGILILSSLSFVPRFALLGLSDVKTVLVIDIISTGIKFVSGYFLVSAGFGAFGMLVSFLLQYLLMAGGFLVLARRRTLEFKFGGIKYAKEIIRDGLANAPSKFSKILILSLSVVLLASIGIKSSDIGIFYVALMVSVVATGGLGSALAYMAIPASAKSGTDLSPESARIGISLMSPLVAALIVSPKYILSIIGTQYESAHTILVVLAIATFLSAITMNTISKFNNLNDSRRILSIGTAEILTFLVGFYLLAPHYGILGAAISTLIAFLSSSVISIRWSGRTSIRYFAVSGIAILSGVSCGYISSLKLGVDPLLVILVSICSTMIFIFILKNTSPGEMAILMRSMISKK